MDRNPIFNLRRFTRLPAFNDIIILVNVWTFSKPISSLIPPQFFLMKILFSLIYLFIYFPPYFHPLNIQARTPLSHPSSVVSIEYIDETVSDSREKANFN